MKRPQISVVTLVGVAGALAMVALSAPPSVELRYSDRDTSAFTYPEPCRVASVSCADRDSRPIQACLVAGVECSIGVAVVRVAASKPRE